MTTPTAARGGAGASDQRCCPASRVKAYSFNLVDGTRTDLCQNCGTKSEPYAPELGQALFGNPTCQHDFDAMPSSYAVEEMLNVLWHFVDGDSYEPFSNDVFEMRPYYWGDVEEETDKPNFLHRASGLEIRWYKHIGRGMTVNKHVCPECFLPIFAECMNSLQGDRP